MDSRPVSRRTLLMTLGLSAVAGCVTPLTNDPDDVTTDSTTAANDDSSLDGWPQVGRTAAHAGTNPAVSVDGEPAPAWEQTVAGSLTTPTVVDDSVYVTRGVPTDDAPRATLEAYALDTGELRWNLPLGFDFQYNAPISNHRPVVHGDRIYVTTRDGIVAVNADALEPEWEVQADAFLNEPPTVTDDGLFAAGRNAFVHLDHDGTEQWKKPIGKTRPRLAAVAGDEVYVPLRERLLSLDAATGDSRWEYAPERGSVGNMAVVRDGTILVTSYYGFEAISADGTRRWRVDGFESEAPHRPVVGEETVFVAGIEGTAAAFDLASGERLWQTSLGDGEWTQETPPVLVDGALYVPQADGEEASVHALDPSSGEEQWNISGTGARIRGPIPAGDHLVVATQDRHVNAGSGVGSTPPQVKLQTYHL